MHRRLAAHVVLAELDHAPVAVIEAEHVAALNKRLLEIIAPLGRKGRVADLTRLYVYLASDGSSYMTGKALSVDGGVTAGISQALLGAVASAMQEEAVA